MSRVVQRKNVGVLQSRQHFDFANEPDLARVRAGVSVQNFERDTALVSRIAGEVDDGKRALPDPTLYLVPAFEGRPETRDRVRITSFPLIASAGLRRVDRIVHRQEKGLGVGIGMT